MKPDVKRILEEQGIHPSAQPVAEYMLRIRNQVEVTNADSLPGFEVDDYQVVMRGRRRHSRC